MKDPALRVIPLRMQACIACTPTGRTPSVLAPTDSAPVHTHALTPEWVPPCGEGCSAIKLGRPSCCAPSDDGPKPPMLGRQTGVLLLELPQMGSSALPGG